VTPTTAPPLAALQCNALAVLAPSPTCLRLFAGSKRSRRLDWRKPAFAGPADVAQWSRTNARSRHASPPPFSSTGPSARGASSEHSAVSSSTGGLAPPGTGLADSQAPLAPLFDAAFSDPTEMEDDLAEVGAEPLPATARAPVSALDDESLCLLIARIGGHDDRALALLYDATSSRVFGFVGRIVNDNGLAEEVVEDTYWQVWRQSERFDLRRGRPLTWLLAMARSRAIDALRRRERQAHLLLDDEAQAALADDGSCGPPDLLAAIRGGHLLHRALSELDSQPRQLISLAFFRGLTHEEIAHVTGLPLGTVKSQIRRALQALKDWLADLGCPDLPL
jgi:RNA polymerase sigma factor (sigma-70 family)